MRNKLIKNAYECYLVFFFRQVLFVDLIKAYINMENQLGHKKKSKKDGRNLCYIQISYSTFATRMLI